jgi:hypothetical protein
VFADARLFQNHLRTVGTLALVARRECANVIGLFELARFGLNLPPEFERVRDVVKWILRAAGSNDENRSKVEHSPDESLIHADAFDFCEHRLDCAPLYESDFYYHALVGDAELRSCFRNVDPEECGERHHERPSAEPPDFHRESRNGDCEEQCAEYVARKKGEPVEAGAVLDGFAGEKVRFGVGHGREYSSPFAFCEEDSAVALERA